jgi:hypothetical protein
VWVASVGYSFGPWLGLSILFITFAKAWIEPNYVRSWGIGAEGETVTERELQRLPDGYELLHDRRLPGSRANIDHVVVGSSGVHVVESKRMAGKLAVRDNEVHIRGRNTHMVDQVLHQVEVVESVLAESGFPTVPVQPVLFVQKVDAPWFLGRPLGVPIVLSGRQLRRAITGGAQVLDDEAVATIASVLDRALVRMIREPGAALPVRPVAPPSTLEPVLAACPRCGNEMVLRRNRQGQAFLGCSQFPRCRGTRAWRST